VVQFSNDKISKITYHHKTGEVTQIRDFVDGKKSKITDYHKTGEVKKVRDF